MNEWPGSLLELSGLFEDMKMDFFIDFIGYLNKNIIGAENVSNSNIDGLKIGVPHAGCLPLGKYGR